MILSVIESESLTLMTDVNKNCTNSVIDSVSLTETGRDIFNLITTSVTDSVSTTLETNVGIKRRGESVAGSESLTLML